MLTDEEKMNMAWDSGSMPEYVSKDKILNFAEAIERAVLEKAIPIPKQEPVALAVYQGCLSGVHVSMLSNAPKDFSGYLYAAPQPAQAAAIPEGWQLVPIEPTLEMIEGFWGKIKHGDDELLAAHEAYYQMLSASTKP